MIDQADEADRRGQDPARRSAAERSGPALPAPRRTAGPRGVARWNRGPWWIWPLLGLAGFSLLLWQVASHGPVTGLDIRVRDHILAWAATPSLGWLAALGRGLADLGNQAVALPVLPLVALFAAWRARSAFPLILAASAGIVLATVVPIKIGVGRPGPGTVALGDASLGYFPSGHTADAMLCYGTSALILCVALPLSRLARQLIVTASVALVVLTAFGLLWSDYHWLSDILGSVCYCGAALLLLHRFAAADWTRARFTRLRSQAPVLDDAGHEGHQEPQKHHERS